MALWEDAYEQQLSLWQWWGSDIGRRFARGYARSIENASEDQREKAIENAFYRGDVESGHIATAVEEAAWLRDHLVATQRAFLLEGDPIAVDADMMTMWEAAMKGFEPEPLQPTDLLVPKGFISLPRPLYTLDVHEKRMAIRAIAWGPGRFGGKAAALSAELRAKHGIGDEFGDGILLSLYSRRGDADDYWSNQFSSLSEWSLSHITPWGFGDTYADVTGGLRSLAVEVQSLFRLLQQHIVLRSHEVPSRPTRRRAAKADFPAKKVVVARLRRPAAPPRLPGDERPAPTWSHRWLVTGHWRQQWYASLGLHRQIWISPFVKGPDDKPLQMRTVHAYELVR